MQKTPFKPYWQQVKGNTWCMVFDYARIPVYLCGEGKAILIDSGYDRNRQEILDLLAEKDLRPVAILTSHTHPDHIGNHAFLQKEFGAKVYMSAFDAATFADPMVMCVSFGARVGYRLCKERFHVGVTADEVFPNTDCEIHVEGVPFRVIPTPGHCVEHTTIVTPDNVAYLGDALQSEDFMVNRRLTYSTVVEEDFASKRIIAQLKCDAYIMAHNAVVEDITDSVETAIEAMEYRLRLFEELLDTPASEGELVRRFLVHTGADLENGRSVRGIHFNAPAFLTYLVDHDRLIQIVEDGYLKYARPNKTES